MPGPMVRTFTYSLPEGMGRLTPGQRVVAPFGKGKKIGFYMGPTEKPSGIEIKPIQQELDADTYFTRDLFDMCEWMGQYYFANPADCLMAALPPHLKGSGPLQYRWHSQIQQLPMKGSGIEVKPGQVIGAQTVAKLRKLSSGVFRDFIRRGLILEEWEQEDDQKRRVDGYRVISEAGWDDVFRKMRSRVSPFDGVRTRSELIEAGWSAHAIGRAEKAGLLEVVYRETGTVLDFVVGKAEVRNIALTEEQAGVVKAVTEKLNTGFQTFLLHGITGSGKTLVYCHLTEACLAKEKTVLVLTPEIALSGATLAYFRGFFGDKVTVIHSAMTDRERLESWQGIRSGRFKIVVGPRSAIFAPLPDLGLVIVDEEHDGSYKQDEPSPRFHGRDCAIMRAKLNNIPVLLGSASPSVESYYHAKSGRYTHLELTQRPGTAVLPKVRVVDMRSEGTKGHISYVSMTLKRGIEERLKRSEQVILYLNRRGYAPMLRCDECGHIPLCPECNLRMTFHKVGNRLTCHYCGSIRQKYDICEKCGGKELLLLGTGTQKVEETLPLLFPQARSVRLDSDSASGRVGAHLILNDVAHRKYDLLLGTQMVTKGLDLPDVSLVGVLLADQGMDLPDFRSSEKSFARLLQVAGRSGRADKPGEVIVQTYAPESPVIVDAARQDYKSFYEQEIKSREAALYPPFIRLANFVLSGPSDEDVARAIGEFRQRLTQECAKANVAIQLLGPAVCPLAMIRGQSRRHLIVKTKQMVRLVKMLAQWEERESRFGLAASLKLVVDVDPDDMM